MKSLSMLKAALFALCLVPLGWLVYDVVTENLSANPIEDVLHRTGLWALRLLIVTLCMSPLKWITGNNQFIRVRRLFGLFTFFYASLHLFVYLVLDRSLAWSHVLEDIVKRPFITVGFGAWLILLPMAVTSNQRMIRRLGKRWKTLHRGIYLVALLSALHFIWLVKADLLEPLIYAGILAALLFARLLRYSRG